MPITPDRILELRAFGLSDYAARAYLALLDLGVSGAREVSRLSRVPIGKIYQTLDQLHERGLAQILPVTPKRYAPVAFAEFLERLRGEHTRTIQRLESDSGRLTALFQVTGSTEIADRGTLTIVRGRANTLEKIGGLAEHAAKDVLGVATRALQASQPHLSRALRRARQRGVRLRLLVPAAWAGMRPPPFHDAAEIRFLETASERPDESVGFWVADAAEALVIHFVPDDPSSAAGKDFGFLTNHGALAQSLAAMLELRWEAGRPAEGETAAPPVRGPEPRPRTLASEVPARPRG